MKKVLITGSSTGIGFECAKYFMDNCFSVIAHYFEKNENISELNKTEGYECIFCDFTDDYAFNEFLSKIKSMEIEVLINNAGMYDFSKKILIVSNLLKRFLRLI